MFLQIVVVVPDTGGTRPCWDYNYFVVCCHPDLLLHPPDTTTPLLARYLLIKIWLPGNRLQTHTPCVHIQLYTHASHSSHHTHLHAHTHTHTHTPHISPHTVPATLPQSHPHSSGSGRPHSGLQLQGAPGTIGRHSSGPRPRDLYHWEHWHAQTVATETQVRGVALVAG